MTNAVKIRRGIWSEIKQIIRLEAQYPFPSSLNRVINRVAVCPPCFCARSVMEFFSFYDRRDNAILRNTSPPATKLSNSTFESRRCSFTPDAGTNAHGIINMTEQLFFAVSAPALPAVPGRVPVTVPYYGTKRPSKTTTQNRHHHLHLATSRTAVLIPARQARCYLESGATTSLSRLPRLTTAPVNHRPEITIPYIAVFVRVAPECRFALVQCFIEIRL